MHINNKYNAKLTFRRQSPTAWLADSLPRAQTAARTRPKTNTANAIPLFNFRLFFMPYTHWKQLVKGVQHLCKKQLAVRFCMNV